MQPLVILHDVRLVPVLELEPFRFATHERPLPSGSCREVPEAWGRYWRDCLADSWIVGLKPLRPGSWHVPTASLSNPSLLAKLLEVLMRDRGGPEGLLDPDQQGALDGGLALFQGDEVLAEPTCCVDLRNLSDWGEAAGYRGSDWRILWIGHPWLSVRFEDRWLVLSGLHESERPAAGWAVSPDDLVRALSEAEGELEKFAARLRPVVAAVAGDEAAPLLARELAGVAK